MKQFRKRHVRVLVVATAVSLVGVGALSGTSQAQTTVPGVDANAVKIGFISAETGPASVVGKGAADACKARVGRQNDAKGVNGRQINVTYVDDQSSPAISDKAKDLVENQKVFAMVQETALGFLDYRYLVDNKIPTIGGGFDGTYYLDKGNEYMISTTGTSAVSGTTWDYTTQMMKKLGAKKLASVGYGTSPSSTASAKAIYDYGAPAAGMSSAYLNTTLPTGSTDVGPIVLGIKNAGADAVYLPMNIDTNFAIVQGLAQNGVKMKANVLATGYGPDLLTNPIMSTLGPETMFFSAFRPIETGGAAVKQMQKDLKKYAGYTGVPTFGMYQGYVGCDMMIYGLEQAGKNLTRQGFVDGIRNGKFENDLRCDPYDLSYANYGKLPAEACVWFVNTKNGKFVVMNKGKPVTGTLRGDPALVAQYTSGATTATTGAATTTTAAR